FILVRRSCIPALSLHDALPILGLIRRRAFWEIQALSLQDSPEFHPDEPQVTLPREGRWEQIQLDYEAQGISLTQHPMAFLRPSLDRKSTRLNSSHVQISYAVFC